MLWTTGPPDESEVHHHQVQPSEDGVKRQDWCVQSDLAGRQECRREAGLRLGLHRCGGRPESTPRGARVSDRSVVEMVKARRPCVIGALSSAPGY